MLNHRSKVNHDFLVHYGTGRNTFEEKLVNYTNLGEIQKYEITFAQHLQDYDFYNSEKLLQRAISLASVVFLENMQSSFDNEAPIANSRYWSTDAYQTKLVNDYIYFNLRE